MFRHTVQHILKPGHRKAYVESLKAFNAAAPGVGLPTYRAWVTMFGDLGTVFTEADSDSLDGHVKAFEYAHKNEEFMVVFRAMVDHFVPGTIRDYPLEPIEL